MTILWLGLVLFGGILLGIQPTLNAGLARHLGHPLGAALVSFGTATVLLVAVALALRPPVPSFADLRLVPPWLWLGGAMGAAFVTIALMATPRLGAAPVVALVICGQLAAALVIDSFGLMGLATRPFDWTKLVGALCLVAGAVLIRWR
ncbi:MAG: DMT family transporter [Geminicoccaceae bacterium]